ncbi:MAG: hypothetical protein IV100_03485 [Myxococcales bacterium]|nr:hypothetical protein [Myxococcales bacterium]
MLKPARFSTASKALSTVLFCATALVGAVACTEIGDTTGGLAAGTRPPPDPEDLVDQSGKGDGSVFNATRLVEDALFEDSGYLTGPMMQAFFEKTPYSGRRSFLADAVHEGIPVSTHIAEIAARHRINPLVLVVKLQVEASLVAADKTPNKFLLDRAMGCGCLDGDPSCAAGQLGLVPQIECAGRVFRSYLDDLTNRGQTVSGWKVGSPKKTSENLSIRPANKATAALYTYTPWVLEGKGGNWLFWNVFQRFSNTLLQQNPNHRWIGGSCSEDSGCAVLDGTCLAGAGATAFCTQACDRYCPDSSAPFSSATFCADLGTSLSGIPGGFCMPRCDVKLFSANGGCAAGFTCSRAERFGEPGYFKDVCWPTW